MSSRAKRAPSSEGEKSENPSKRQRVHKDDGESAAAETLSLTDLNDNCLLHMMPNLPNSDLNSFAMVNRHFRQLRNHESLDQTRTATIICRENSTTESFLNNVEANDFNSQLVGNLTQLRIEHLDRIEPEGVEAVMDILEDALPEIQLTNIQSLDCSSIGRTDIPFNTLFHLSCLLPNLRSVDLSNIQSVPGSLGFFCGHVPNLRKVSWNGARNSIYFNGKVLERAANLTELYIDDCQFILGLREGGIPVEDRLLFRCNSLERVSIKNVTFARKLDGENVSPVTQNMLIKFARRSPTLRWLRSDLMVENIAMLKRERPEVTFVSD